MLCVLMAAVIGTSIGTQEAVWKTLAACAGFAAAVTVAVILGQDLRRQS